MAEAVSLSKELNDIPGIAEATFFAARLSHYRRNHGEVERLASDLIELSTRQNFAQAINKLQKSSWDNTLRLPSFRLYAWGRSNYNV